MASLGKLMHEVFVNSYGCPTVSITAHTPPHSKLDFGLLGLARSASSLGPAAVVSLFEDLFNVAHDEVKFMRTSADAPLIDWGDLVKQATDNGTTHWRQQLPQSMPHQVFREMLVQVPPCQHPGYQPHCPTPL